MDFLDRCLRNDPHSLGEGDAALQAVQTAAERIRASGVELVRLGWCDLHGVVRSKALTADAAIRALRAGMGMPGTLMLKDSADRTAYKVFEAGGAVGVPGFAGGGNVLLLPDPASFRLLPWLQGTGWLRCDAWFQSGKPVGLDTRRLLRAALERLARHGLGLVCGLEVEFHIYRLCAGEGKARSDLDPSQADWPGPAPQVELLHPGFHMMSEQWLDLAEPALRIVQHTAQSLGLPLTSVEIEMGPSQVEAVFEATDALTAADHMVLFRNAVKQALRRAGYHATFMCRPPFPRIMSSGWHLHQSVVSLESGRNMFMRDAPALQAADADARRTLSDTGAAWLAGLLAHAPGMAALAVPTLNGFARFQPNALAPSAAVWGHDNRGAMLRVVGEAGDSATRIENRLGEPAANPYLYMASQIHAGLDGLERGLQPAPATESPYAPEAPRLPTTLAQAVAALQQDTVLSQGLGEDWVSCYARIKAAEIQRQAQAADAAEFERREYFSRI
jgi:glutamine synthetase